MRHLLYYMMLCKEEENVYTISVRRHFDAAHALRGYRGKCERLHGHRWEVVAAVRVPELDDIGLGVDYGIIKQALDGVLARLDHVNLNEVPPFDAINPSSEHLANHIYEQLQASLDLPVSEVQVFESPDAWVTYTPD